MPLMILIIVIRIAVSIITEEIFILVDPVVAETIPPEVDDLTITVTAMFPDLTMIVTTIRTEVEEVAVLTITIIHPEVLEESGTSPLCVTDVEV